MNTSQLLTLVFQGLKSICVLRIFVTFYSRPDGMNNDYGKTNNMSHHISKSAQHLKIIKNERKG